MCVGITSKIIKIEDSTAVVDVLGAQREISLLLLDEPVEIGDYVIVHAGFAIRKIQEEDALKNLEFRKKVFEMSNELSPSLNSTNRGRKKVTAYKKKVVRD